MSLCLGSEGLLLSLYALSDFGGPCVVLSVTVGDLFCVGLSAG